MRVIVEMGETERKAIYKERDRDTTKIRGYIFEM